ncbi:hypothetical protein QP992_08725 [Corynebacterium ulcerans]|uniref:hypothetical protein n=1 Tax=Corynebacterium ulcerans TaxID=65058 RepID=UPI00254A40C1|nr:hypothetical protein [Corynebacterium ulcerans]MDK8889226.1 hypothetical protein [Corynebacterium ulcerans]
MATKNWFPQLRESIWRAICAGITDAIEQGEDDPAGWIWERLERRDLLPTRVVLDDQMFPKTVKAAILNIGAGTHQLAGSRGGVERVIADGYAARGDDGVVRLTRTGRAIEFFLTHKM